MENKVLDLNRLQKTQFLNYFSRDILSESITSVQIESWFNYLEFSSI
jgi:hypothetical protein